MLLSSGIAFFIGLRQSAGTLRVVVIYLLVSFLSDLIFRIAYIFFDFYIKTGVFFRLVEFVLLIEFYSLILQLKKLTIFKRFIQVISVVLYIVIFEFDLTLMRTTNSVFFSLLSTGFFIKMIMEMKVNDPLKFPLFWINAAFLVYFSGSVFFSLSFDILGRLHEMSAVLSFGFHNTLGLAKNILIAIAFWISYKHSDWDKSLLEIKERK
ncbi:hypothetical protein C900_05517 [Fulvivirga imtechensis AK7]|uniref:Uncharacterized protein n=2 Tax=Fulvivirga TaxID=396811 RepID=L8JNT0_9BACT|nr:hypothetical protein C900_05517 [Fulvivirga imtechensis AK7]